MFTTLYKKVVDTFKIMLILSYLGNDFKSPFLDIEITIFNVMGDGGISHVKVALIALSEIICRHNGWIYTNIEKIVHSATLFIEVAF